ncbi:protein phosphatase 2C domain-containing protein [Streptomyces sp. NPDC059900]|uniref:protein phosphatase 2C domain-containing protein n=1 Tax=Streptomyces sp. NPDC059900 TaxID=3155816 RepID=UPI0034444C3F
MSQQGERHDGASGQEDDWWGQLYDDSAHDTGPAEVADSLDDRFASAVSAAAGEGVAEPSPAGGGAEETAPLPGRFPDPEPLPPDFTDRRGAPGATRNPSPRTPAPAPHEPSTPPGPPPAYESAPTAPREPSAPAAPGDAYPAPREPSTPPGPPPAYESAPTAPREPSAPAVPGDAYPAPREPSAPAAPADAYPAPQEPTAPAVPGDAYSAPREPSAPAVPGDAYPAPREPSAPAAPGDAGPAPRVPPAPPGPAPAHRPSPTAPREPTAPAPGGDVESAPREPFPPREPPAPAHEPPAAARFRPAAAPWEPAAAPAGPVTFPAGPAKPSGDPSRTTAVPAPRAPEESAVPDPQAPAPAPEPTVTPAPADAVPYVGDGPPTYDAEPTVLPAADPDDLGDLVADTVLDGARYGTSTLRAVSVRGDSARYRGEPRRDSLLTARFGTGDSALVLVAMATGARATPGAHRAAAEACAWIGRAVGRSHQRLSEDIRAGRRGDLKSGLHRLTDRSLGKLRAHAADLGIEPEEYAASLRCLLLPADPECRTRVFFGVGSGGLFRLRDGAFQDIEPRVSDTAGDTGPPVVGFGSVPPQTPEGDRLTMDMGIITPPSPYEPAPEPPPREPFRFRASVARPGDALLLCSGGLAEPLSGEPEFAAHLTQRWAKSGPPGLVPFLADIQVRVKGYADDRTAAAVWEA